MDSQQTKAPLPERLKKAVEVLQLAERLHGEASQHLDQAQSRATERLNALNRAQREVDALIAEARKSGARESDWGLARCATSVEVPNA